MILVWLLDEAEQRRDKATWRRQPGSGSDLLQVAANVGHLHVAAVMVPALQKVKCHPASPFCLPPRSLRNGSRKLFCPLTITGVKKKIPPSPDVQHDWRRELLSTGCRAPCLTFSRPCTCCGRWSRGDAGLSYRGEEEFIAGKLYFTLKN